MSTTNTTVRLTTLLAVVWLPLWTTAQNFEVSSGPPFTPENLISNVFLGEGVEVIDLQYDGQDPAVGFFNNATDEIGIQRGIVMSTGRVSSTGFQIGIDEAGIEFADSEMFSMVPLDPDLLEITDNFNLNDIARYTITFIPTSDTLQFNYIFASEEYPEFTCSDFNDVFGFFISGPGINGPFQNNAENIALIPGTNLPVTINNVNGGQIGTGGNSSNCTPPEGSLDFAQYYTDNNNSNQRPVFDGFTSVFTAQAIVQPCSTYVMKIAIADVGDDNYDSAVFLEAKSFGTGSVKVDALTVSLDGSVAEGCAEATLNFELPTPAESDYIIDYTVFGEAIEGVDYNELPDTLFIPAGDTLVSLTLSAFIDDLIEGPESFFLDVQIDPCNRDTIPLIIQDNPLVDINLGADTTICPGDSLSLTGEVPIPLPAPPSFSSTASVNIPDIGDFRDIIFPSDITVTGVQPPTLQPGVIQSVCIDSLEHRWIDDLDIFLVSPGGQFIELTTDNGGNGANGLGIDQFIGTCFTPDAINPITSVLPTDGPFTGDWQPEGLWTDLYGSSSPTNGIWTLQIIDDQVNVGGTLFQWTITFNPIYDIAYSWFPTTGLSCSDCPNPVATVDSTTTYIVNATDAYGCITSDTITISVFGAPDAPELSCELVTGNSITISWPDVPGANDYEVNVDSTGWTATSGPNSHTVDGLPNLTEVYFEVRALGQCSGAIDSIRCTTLNDCEEPVVTLNTTTDISCFGGDDGSLAVLATGEDGPFEYQLQGQVNTTGLFDSLSAGTYTVSAEDTVGCVGFLEVTLSEPDDIEATLVQQNTDCAGEATGTATVDISNGTSPYSFSWSNTSTDSVQTNLSAGNYTLTVQDANGCEYTYSFDIAEPDSLQATVETDSASCNGFDTGSATVSVSGGTGVYDYNFSGGNSMEQSVSELSAGDYTVTVTDANNCPLEVGFTIFEPTAVSLQIDSAAVSCANGTDGSLSVQANGGTAPYVYQWFDPSGATVGDTDTLNGLPAAIYSLSVTDDNGCLATGSATIGAPEALQIDLSTEAASCDGVADGSALLSASGGTPPYTYLWSDGGPDSPDRSGLGLGNYSATVSDANGCVQTTTFSISAPTALQLNLSAQPTQCFDSADGQATISVTGGNGNYSYDWSNGQSGTVATGLPPGTVNVTVEDENGCTATDSIVIMPADTIRLELTGNDPTCFGNDDGSILAEANGGAGGFSYDWSNGSGSPSTQGLAAGVYSLTLTDGNGCTLTDSLELDQPDLLSSDISSLSATCLPEPDGEARVDIDGGTPPYNIEWSNGQEGNNLNGLPSGTYTVTITDSNGCTLSDTTVVDAIPGIDLTVTTTDVSCNGGDNGQATISATGGDGNYSYNWNNNLPSQPAFNNLSAGAYTVTVTDGLGCEAIISLDIIEPAALEVNLQIDQVGCAGGNDGGAAATTTGGIPPYTYNWSNGASGSTVGGLPIGEYGLIVLDANGCETSVNFIVEESEPIFISSEVTAVSCFDERDGSVSLSVSGGQPPYTYSWPSGGTTSSENGLSAGDYTVTVSDAGGCIVTEELFVPQPDSSLGANLQAEDVSCFGLQDGRIVVDASGGTPPYRYSIDGDFFSGSRTFLGLPAGTYELIVRDANGCTFQSPSIAVGEPEPIAVDLGETRSIPLGITTILSPEISGGVPPLSYAWSPQDSSKLSCFNCLEPVVNISFQTTFRLTVTDASGCTGESLVTLFARKDRPVFVPTGFTPNGDNRNDRLYVQTREGVELDILYFRIFDRWGEQVFENTDFTPNVPAEGWDGHFRGKPLMPGTYIWHIGVKYADGLLDSFSGQTTIIR